jgi:hypothetical protein
MFEVMLPQKWRRQENRETEVKIGITFDKIYL